MKKIALIVIPAIMLSGCASYVIKSGDGRVLSQGECHGFFRTITVCEKYDKSGNVTERKISTDSNTKDVLMGLNTFIDTAVNTYSKLKP